MGTNYYTATKVCRECGNKPEGIHLGKSSAGWQFTFQYNGGTYYKNVQEMKEWLADKQIENEYHEQVSHEKFWKMVEEKQKPENLNHAKEMLANYPAYTHAREHLIEGYSFSDGEFS